MLLCCYGVVLPTGVISFMLPVPRNSNVSVNIIQYHPPTWCDFILLAQGIYLLTRFVLESKHCFKWQSAKEPFLRYGQNCRYWMFKTLHGFSMSSLLCVIVGLPGWFPLFLSLCATLAKPNNSWLKFYTSHRDLRVVLIVQFNIRHERQFRCFPQISNYTCISFSSLSCCSSC